MWQKLLWISFMLLTSSLLCSCFVIQVVSCNSSYRWYKIELMFSLTDVLNVFGFALIHTFLTTEKTKLCFDNYQDYHQKTKLVRGTIQRKQSQERRGVQSGVCVVDFFFLTEKQNKPVKQNWKPFLLWTSPAFLITVKYSLITFKTHGSVYVDIYYFE